MTITPLPSQRDPFGPGNPEGLMNTNTIKQDVNTGRVRAMNLENMRLIHTFTPHKISA
jgi:hypothetical protein